VFIGGFGYPYWYDYYPYSYYDYDYEPVAYTDDGSIVAQVQQQLARAGYYYGPIDGVLGPRTQAAIRSFERANGLRVDGMISNELIATMGLGYARN
jgi:N-acetylmuramoyl-L-alanine amidase